MDLKKAQIDLDQKINDRKRIKERDNANLEPLKFGFYTVTAPRSGIILSADFRENLLGKTVKPGDPLIRVGYTDVNDPKIEDWELLLKIPQKHYGQVMRAFERLPPGAELDVDVLFQSKADQAYRAKLRRDRIAKQANTEKDDNNEAEPVVIAWARVHPIDGDIAPQDQIPGNLLLSGSAAHTRIRCGNAAMGYSLFYGVYEFAYEKVIFPYSWR
jgi:hypothetical protein